MTDFLDLKGVVREPEEAGASLQLMPFLLSAETGKIAPALIEKTRALAQVVMSGWASRPDLVNRRLVRFYQRFESPDMEGVEGSNFEMDNFYHCWLANLVNRVALTPDTWLALPYDVTAETDSDGRHLALADPEINKGIWQDFVERLVPPAYTHLAREV
jgi:hypothetical protein